MGNPGRTPEPTVVRIASGLMLMIIIGGGIGVALLTRHIWLADQTESPAERARDVAFLAERLLQWLAAGTAMWGIRQQRAIGRWLAVGLALYLAMKTSFASRGALQAIMGEPDTLSSMPYESPAEGVAGLFATALIVSGLTAIAWSMTRNKKVREYFADGDVG